ncbi:LysR family transcriptional regulator [Pseudomonas lundensis]|uniref:LysR family transcriptional regulator n=1 Tax=Pseudomonas lundensis TaxID=86185 RepID=A0A266N7L7_9PSED|nr:LysR family transcriptional regulator [Pseudomonas lundensis]OZY57795.1 LysR family transcriptional regulator [Pseudomonas lundensis]
MDYFAALSAFVEAAQANNFSRAAEKLSIKASTVSRYIKDLEQDLGIALFNRSTRTLRLTEGGETFLQHAVCVLDALDHAKQATSSLNQHPRGLLKLNVPPAFARQHILPLLGEFMSRHPEVRLELTLDDHHVSLINAGVDLAVRIGVLPDSSLKARKLASERTLVCVSAAYAQQHPAPAVPQEVSAVLINGNLPEEVFFVPAFGHNHAVERVPVAGPLRINDLDAQLLAVEQGLGVACLPDWLVARKLASGALVQWLPQWQVQATHVPASLWLVYPPKRTVSSKVRCFIDFMVERVGSPAYWQP